eukprot:12402760-Karenia_brevis.AAC.1
MTSNGVFSGMAFHRRTVEERWTWDDWDALSGLPWNIGPRAGQAEVEHLISIQAPAVPVTMEAQDRPFMSRD